MLIPIQKRFLRYLQRTFKCYMHFTCLFTKNMSLHILLGIGLLSNALYAAQTKPIDFFAMTFGFKNHSIAQQIEFLSDSGYNGIGAFVFNEAGLEQLKKMLQHPIIQHSNQSAHGSTTAKLSNRQTHFKIYGVYMPLSYHNKKHKALIHHVLQATQGFNIPIWLTLRDGNQQNGEAALTDTQVVKYIQAVSDLAKQYQTQVILYPHDMHYALTVEHTVKLLKLAQRDNLFTSIHLNHILRAGNADRLEEIIKLAAPYAKLASLSGANQAPYFNTGSRDWSDVNQPLKNSAFDVENKFYRLLIKHGFTGAIAYNNFGITEDTEAHHLSTLQIFRSWQAN